jgi:hypothetical protein
MSARGGRRLAALAAVALCAAALAAPAHATVVLGQADSDPGAVNTDPTSRQCAYTGAIYAPGWHNPDPTPDRPPLGAPDSTVPAGGGVLTSWTISGQQAGTQARLAVIRFPTDYELQIVERGPVETVPRTIDPVTFPVRLPVSAGDVIALDVVNLMLPAEDCVFPTGHGSLSFTYVAGDQPADGQVSRFTQGDGYDDTHLNLTATLEPPGAAPPPPPPPPPALTFTPRWPRLTGIRWRAPRHGHLKRGTARNDRLLGGPGSDRLDGRRGDDVLLGDRFGRRQPARQRDRLVGGPGNDLIYAGPGWNGVWAGPGDDVVLATRGHGLIRCGAGRDVVLLASRHRFRLSGCERVFVVRR